MISGTTSSTTSGNDVEHDLGNDFRHNVEHDLGNHVEHDLGNHVEHDFGNHVEHDVEHDFWNHASSMIASRARLPGTTSSTTSSTTFGDHGVDPNVQRVRRQRSGSRAARASRPSPPARTAAPATTLFQCINGCDSGDTTCVDICYDEDNCYASNPPRGCGYYNALNDCLCKNWPAVRLLAPSSPRFACPSKSH